MVSQTAVSPKQARWIAAYQRAQAERLVPEYVDGTTFRVKSYTVLKLSRRWDDLVCDCKAGQRGIPCKHCAVVAKSIALGIRCHARQAAPAGVNHGSQPAST